MQQYRVIAGVCPGKKTIHPYGAIITADDVDDAEQRVKDRFLVAIEAEETPAPVGGAPVIAPAPADEQKGGTPTDLTKDPKDMDKQELMDLLTAKGIPFKAGSSRDTLLKLVP